MAATNSISPFHITPFCKLDYKYTADVDKLKAALCNQIGSNYPPLPFNDPKLFRGDFSDGSFKLRRRMFTDVPWEAVALIDFSSSSNTSTVHITFRVNFFYLFIEVLLLIFLFISMIPAQFELFGLLSMYMSLFICLYGIYLLGFWYQVHEFKNDLEKYILQ